MTTYFNQEGQQVHGPQTNIVGEVAQVNVGAIGDQAGLVSELERLKSELASRALRGEIEQGLATDAEYQLAQARDEANKPEPDRGRFLGHLIQAKDLLTTAAAAAGLVTTLEKLAEVAKQLL